MHIAGGIYRELCVMPSWNALLGSGGRAAATIAALSPASTLHSYAEDAQHRDLIAVRELGIELRLAHRTSAIAFAYFHPLSHPHVEPSPRTIASQPSLRVDGDSVLRFGFLEGDAIVTARRAVYDPQTWRDPQPFAANGSNAERLAIVLNELELRSASGLMDLEQAAANLMQHQGADIVVAKGGARGATVFEKNGRCSRVPAYRSPRVFKIGTGDVFSAVFAHLWCEAELDPADAADRASRSVADYCSTGHLPVATTPPLASEAVGPRIAGPVVLEGAVNTIGCRYAMEEARFGLRELGLEVVSEALDGQIGENSTPAALLVLADGIDQAGHSRALGLAASGVPVVVLRERETELKGIGLDDLPATITNDFVSALYCAAWGAMNT